MFWMWGNKLTRWKWLDDILKCRNGHGARFHLDFLVWLPFSWQAKHTPVFTLLVKGTEGVRNLGGTWDCSLSLVYFHIICSFFPPSHCHFPGLSPGLLQQLYSLCIQSFSPVIQFALSFKTSKTPECHLPAVDPSSFYWLQNKIWTLDQALWSDPRFLDFTSSLSLQLYQTAYCQMPPAACLLAFPPSWNLTVE